MRRLLIDDLALLTNLRNVLCKKLICSRRLYDWSAGWADLVEEDKAQGRQHPYQSAESPEQARIPAVKDQPREIRTNGK